MPICSPYSRMLQLLLVCSIYDHLCSPQKAPDGEGQLERFEYLLYPWLKLYRDAEHGSEP